MAGQSRAAATLFSIAATPSVEAGAARECNASNTKAPIAKNAGASHYATHGMLCFYMHRHPCFPFGFYAFR